MAGGQGDGVTDGRIVGWLCVPHATHVVGIQFIEVSHQLRDIVSGVGAVPVNTHDHFARSSLQSLVQGVWHHALRVVKQLDEGVLLGIASHDISGMVSTPAVDEEQFKLILWIVLLQNRQNAPFNEFLFIEKRADD